MWQPVAAACCRRLCSPQRERDCARRRHKNHSGKHPRPSELGMARHSLGWLEALDLPVDGTCAFSVVYIQRVSYTYLGAFNHVGSSKRRRKSSRLKRKSYSLQRAPSQPQSHRLGSDAASPKSLPHLLLDNPSETKSNVRATTGWQARSTSWQLSC